MSSASLSSLAQVSYSNKPRFVPGRSSVEYGRRAIIAASQLQDREEREEAWMSRLAEIPLIDRAVRPLVEDRGIPITWLVGVDGQLLGVDGLAMVATACDLAEALDLDWRSWPSTTTAQEVLFRILPEMHSKLEAKANEPLLVPAPTSPRLAEAKAATAPLTKRERRALGAAARSVAVQAAASTPVVELTLVPDFVTGEAFWAQPARQKREDFFQECRAANKAAQARKAQERQEREDFFQRKLAEAREARDKARTRVEAAPSRNGAHGDPTRPLPAHARARKAAKAEASRQEYLAKTGGSSKGGNKKKGKK